MNWLKCVYVNFNIYILIYALPKSNSKFAPENGWFGYYSFLLGREMAFAVSFREGNMELKNQGQI